MPTVTSDFRIQAYSKKQLCDLYGVSGKTLKAWMKRIQSLGEYNGRAYTPAQVQIITQHLGTP